jgi:SAM-dependent methyltransferase/uncharacterized protein YbaR (Trm112 family)
MDSWFVENLVCPRDHSGLSYQGSSLRCANGHEYPVVDGVPVMLLNDVEQTLGVAQKSYRSAVTQSHDSGSLYLESVGLSEDEIESIRTLSKQTDYSIDPVVSYLVGATNGIAYKHLLGKLNTYPIPRLRLPAGNGKKFLDIGCNWGRWCVSAARKGYEAVGIDPSLGAIMAARRVSKRLGVNANYVVGDARFLPFKEKVFDSVFSYSVIQHFSRENAGVAVGEAARVLKVGGYSFIQMPTKYGIRCLYHQARRGFKEGQHFDVRYWSIPSLKKLFTKQVGPSSISVDCYFGIGLQPSDLSLMPLTHKVAILMSELLRGASNLLPPLRWIADSVYVKSVKSTA